MVESLRRGRGFGDEGSIVEELLLGFGDEESANLWEWAAVG